MVDFIKRAPRIKAWRDKMGKRLDAGLIVLSIMSVALVAINELVPENFALPWVNLSWTEIVQISRLVTWASFVGVFATMCCTSHRSIFNYSRKWWLELSICIVWMPFFGNDLLQQTHSVISAQTLLMLGIIAHVARVSRWAIQRFTDHPLVVVGAATVTVVSSGTVLVMLLEPQTFATFQDSVFSIYLASLTLGGPLVPATIWGRIAYLFVVTAGVSVLAVYYGVVREFVHQFLFKDTEIENKIFEHMKLRSAQLDRQQQQIDGQARDLTELRAAYQAQSTQLAALCAHFGVKLPEPDTTTTTTGDGGSQ